MGQFFLNRRSCDRTSENLEVVASIPVDDCKELSNDVNFGYSKFFFCLNF